MSDENEELRNAGLKVTAPRLKILQILETSSARHMSAEDVYRHLVEAGEDVGIATVYRVLTQFESAGLVERHNFDSGPAVYEIDRGEHHDHMVCTETGKVIVALIQRKPGHPALAVRNPFAQKGRFTKTGRG